jgi:Putative lumazine-binding
MTARPLTVLLLPLLAVGLGACASTASTSNFKGEQHAVAQTVSNLQSHATALEQKKICGEDLASATVARLNTAPGGCDKAIESQLKEIDSFEATVESVQISGAHASARVKSVHSGKKAISTLTLVKEGGRWKISGL